MSNEQKPSENALDVVDEIEVALTLSLKVLPSESQREAVARLIDRERREARAEAFDICAKYARIIESEVDGDCCAENCDEIAEHYEELAAKERAS